MIVQCDECNAKFRLDDSKVKEGGTKVRCSKCKHIFLVQKEAAAEESDLDSFLDGLVPPSSGKAAEATAPPARQAVEAPEPPEPAKSAPEPPPIESPALDKDEFDFGEFALDTGGDTSPAVPVDAGQHEGFDIDVDLEFGAPAAPATGTPEKGDVTFDDDAFFFNEPPAPAAPKEESAPPSFDYDAFSFSEEPPPSVTPVTDAERGAPPGDFDTFSFTEEPLQATPRKDETPDVATSFDFDTFSFDESPPSAPEAVRPEEPVAAVMPAAAPESPKDEDIFSDVPPLDFSFEPDAADRGAAIPEPQTAKNAGEATPFDFGDFEFEGEAPAEKPAGMGNVPRQEEKPTSFVEEHGTEPSGGEVPFFTDEAPPLSISSRRRGGSIVPIAVTAFCVLLVIALVGGGFLFFNEGPAGLNRVGLGFVSDWFGLKAKEEGGIAVRNPVASFMNNKEAGEIFVVNGEVVNNFAKPRASIQVKATLYGTKGEVLQQKTAYCGNSLSREQLTTLPVAELEKLMANPFGDSLSNLAVQPGKAIPFVVVFTGVPKGAADFGIEVVGSTIASK